MAKLVNAVVFQMTILSTDPTKGIHFNLPPSIGGFYFEKVLLEAKKTILLRVGSPIFYKPLAS